MPEDDEKWCKELLGVVYEMRDHLKDISSKLDKMNDRLDEMNSRVDDLNDTVKKGFDNASH